MINHIDDGKIYRCIRTSKDCKKIIEDTEVNEYKVKYLISGREMWYEADIFNKTFIEITAV